MGTKEYKDRGVHQNLDWYGFLHWELGKLSERSYDGIEEDRQKILDEIHWYESILLDKHIREKVWVVNTTWRSDVDFGNYHKIFRTKRRCV